MSKIHKHRTKKGKVEVKCQWKDPTKSVSWVDMFSLALQDPVPILWYAKKQHLLSTKPFAHLSKYCAGEAKSDLARAYKAATKPGGKKYKFGVQVPYSVKQALELDRINGDTMWLDAIKKELKQLNEYQTFKLLDKGELPPTGYQKIPYHIVFDVKFDLRRKARLVAGGNCTSLEREDIYSGVVGLDSIRIGMFLGELNSLSCCAADVGNAYLYSYTKEKVYIVAGPDFGELEGRILLIVKALYGLRTSAARWREHLAEKLRSMGYHGTKADPNLWIKDMGSHYKYIATYLDDLLVWLKDPMSVIKTLEKDYILKGVGIPEYYLGGNMESMDDHWKREGINLGFLAQTYIKNMVPKYEKLFDRELKTYKTPMAEDYHPEVDDSPFVSMDDAAIYRSITGSINWLVTLGRFDLAYANSTMSRYNMQPREGHMKQAKRMLGYVKMFSKGKLLFDTSFPNHADLAFVEQNWEEFYPGIKEELPPDMPEPKGKPVRITVYVDADHAHDVVTRRSVSGILLMLNNTPIRWVSKRQKTVETSTYGSELVAARLSVELIMEVRYQLRMLGVPVDGPADLLGDNMAVILNTTVPSSQLKKKHNAIAYHRVREACAVRIVQFFHIESSRNYADILTKPLANKAYYNLANPLLFRVPKMG